MSRYRVSAIRLLCPDPAATARFYKAVFGCAAHPAPHGVTLDFPRGRVELSACPPSKAAPAPANSTGFQHFAVIVSDMDAAYGHLGSVPGWTAITRAGPARLPASSGGVMAFKFRDPDGHPLELLGFPPGGAPDAWRDRPGLFLGIDHTAITVADTQRAIAFYAELGFSVSARSLNQGPEQAQLDGLDAPRVEVTALAQPGDGPPHLELLCYVQPGTIADARPADDVLASRIVLLDTEARPGARSDVVDPDGHRLSITDGGNRPATG